MRRSEPVPAQKTDAELVSAAVAGGRGALELLLARHRPFIFNVAWKMVLSPTDADDITQEVLIKIATHLSQFRGDSLFSTWVYRIVLNHVRQMKRRPLEEIVTDFAGYFAGLAQTPDTALSHQEALELSDAVEEVKLSCTAGMLLCLDREQRLVLVLGDIFGVDHNIGAEVFEISPANYRQRLSRARKDLYSWMNQKCGLVNEENPCRCAKKTRAFIQMGYVDPKSLKFNSGYRMRVKDIAGRDLGAECTAVEEAHRALFQEHPFKDPPGPDRFRELLRDERVRSIYDL